jgi:RNA polymerase sigma-70 factor (ECF subfamily)
LSYEEIALELQLPLGTVKAQLFRAKELMYEHLNSPAAMACLEITSKREMKKVRI